MDVYGKAPKDAAGEYFRASIWSWPAIWEYCCEVGGDLISKEVAEGGHYNQGAGLDAEAAAKLGRRLARRVATGEVQRWAEGRQRYLEGLPDEVCGLCEGTGWRAEPPNRGAGPEGAHGCNGCGGSCLGENEKGSGWVRPFETNYPYRPEMVAEFGRFLEGCGGFAIW